MGNGSGLRQVRAKRPGVPLPIRTWPGHTAADRTCPTGGIDYLGTRKRMSTPAEFIQPGAKPPDPEPPAPRVYEIPEDPSHARIQTVLVLEDDPELCSMLQVTLEQQDYRVTIVHNGAQGVQQILARNFDAILCDIMMPNFPGDMFYLAVQRTKPDLCKRFIFMTGHQNDPKIREFLARVPCRILYKPFTLQALFDALESVTGRSH
jgi:CheY-like chemotaxis protein